ncbi:class I SAM-dependent methyltransferase [Variovorax arabinosiphilus]|uniref:class I SAM-dependent methyltransferase n=1 Tax=Variovorax arabinosiphilus TaxID=3053498 RepID=UPI002575F204|nr:MULTISPECIES: class I SAM-dependent methyltransferase [unclassified Variovorax]MDM0123266.1 class I SAM-dependent methyltransferase [Variovorax sp. J2L1-78]MDM0131738.1 class I SAM-dependent methyltransferase [Variovorax sp. J2L1-63]MDM0236029.1 class I SAM-dependent methyltransferase [Variovorax sp. J2R1-6]
MSGFSADWLAQREPFDRAARASAAAAFDWKALATQLRHERTGDAAITVLDLGCGTGANLRELAPRLGGMQRWRLVDHDAALLAAVPEALMRWARPHGWRVRPSGDGLRVDGGGLQLDIACVQADLAADADTVPFDGAQLVTCAALLDLVSAPWLEALVARCAGIGAAVCWALSVDGRLTWTDAEADDALVHEAFRAHQRRDKGFGAALGDAAVQVATQSLATAGYRLQGAESDWVVDGTRSAADRAMLRALVDGMANAAREQCPAHARPIDAWHTRRLATLGATRLRVGHIDLLGWRTADD